MTLTEPGMTPLVPSTKPGFVVRILPLLKSGPPLSLVQLRFRRWQSPVGEIAGGIDILANRPKDRVVTAEEVAAREPDLIIGLWCRGPVMRSRKSKFAKTPRWRKPDSNLYGAFPVK
jgi:hypothetical protein